MLLEPGGELLSDDCAADWDWISTGLGSGCLWLPLERRLLPEGDAEKEEVPAEAEKSTVSAETKEKSVTEEKKKSNPPETEKEKV